MTARTRRAFFWLFLFCAGVVTSSHGVFPSLLRSEAIAQETQADGQAAAPRIAPVLEINGPIGPAVADYIVDGIAAANKAKACLIIIQMDTPGGLDASMRRIIKAILSSDVPVASYVSPSGARAASAGTYILYASHIAAMAPGTNLGAATPVQLGGGPSPLPGGGDQKPAASKDGSGEKKENGDSGEAAPAKPLPSTPSNEESERAKVINDATAYIKGLAELRGRNVEWAEKAVRQAASLTADEAVSQNVVDFIATSLSDLVEKSDGRKVKVDGEVTSIHSSGASLEQVKPDWATRLLAAITDPNVAFLLMTLGFYGLFFELANPGSVLPGVMGLISLILGLYALSVLPVSLAGAALLALGFILMVAEAFVVSGGVLGVGGLVSFAVGASMLFDTNAPGFQISWEVILGATVVTGVFVAAVVLLAVGAHTRRVVTGAQFLMRQHGVVESWDNGKGWIMVEGERWRAESDQPLQPGQSVKITGISGLTLKVVAA